ncbi:MAG TPA: tRNA pseudouridine(55) synthase TruB [Alphaproteobacteria bacterium]|jgi:tRNA pseudouridine55 synthase|nr:tRNA pseudouridine(55) synthase TruB [Alphaproteobacteria bacterium]HAM46517.1 tRNA pseudouridine(55) synthase TruB [Alphaproteobacteria bacterium]HBA42600.1 tRNA pseudouridine(55) synthase TruB [Alphaproteobacteria bacterium]HBC55258.1 tRNA pseudouridine(55) synthase TruB [Alphaproteobacteria bacterium]HBF99106.1 tRNA pseudouridine(55) synthase TruB [Alphaproteobacteria bacterium]
MGRRRKKGKPVSGWVCVDKPAGVTSTQIVGKVRYAFDAQKAGHAGTLDPLATGILAIALGEATKTVPYAMDSEKIYRFSICWGEQRSTDDPEGTVIACSDNRPSKAEIEAALPDFIGEILQVPPSFSAIKVNGARAYDLAREGETVTLEPRPVKIDDLRLVDMSGPDSCEMEMVCGKGAYVRAIARDLARKLGTYGYAANIRRTKVGAFCEKNAISLDKLEQLVHKPALSDFLLPVQTPLDDIPALAISGNDAGRLKRGQPILVRNGHELAEESLIYTTRRGQIVALGHVERGEFKPMRIFNLPMGVMTSDVDYS